MKFLSFLLLLTSTIAHSNYTCLSLFETQILSSNKIQEFQVTVDKNLNVRLLAFGKVVDVPVKLDSVPIKVVLSKFSNSLFPNQILFFNPTNITVFEFGLSNKINEATFNFPHTFQITTENSSALAVNSSNLPNVKMYSNSHLFLMISSEGAWVGEVSNEGYYVTVLTDIETNILNFDFIQSIEFLETKENSKKMILLLTYLDQTQNKYQLTFIKKRNLSIPVIKTKRLKN